MGNFIAGTGITLAFGGRDILKDVSLRLAAGSRSCLSGANGSGKSTLMKIIAGLYQSDSGSITMQKGTRVSYLPQDGILHHGNTLREEAEKSYKLPLVLIERLEEIGHLLEDINKSVSAAKSLIEEHHILQEQIENSGYYERDAEITFVLTGLGFSMQDLTRYTHEFSGGWQMRIALAKTLLEKPDILLLDEPTNYLDIEARTWLETYLNNYKGGYLLVSHDRYFLDVCVNEVFELFNGNLKRYAGNYSFYEKQRKIELESLIKQYEEQQKEIVKTEALIRRFRYKASKAAFAQELIKRLEKMEIIEIPESLKKINISFPPPPHSPNTVLTLSSLSKSYGERQVLKNLDINLDAGERLLVAGPNGAGKSTLLRIIAGMDNEFTGTVKYGTGISTGYFSPDFAEKDLQEQDREKRIIDYMEEICPTHLVPKLRDMLGAFLFRGDDVYKSICVLSGGEKSRLFLLKIFLKPFNLLILDEPTNHLDLYSKDILLQALKKYGGTIIFVSHDRSFMEALSTKTLELGRDAKSRLFYGDYAYYLERIESEGRESERIDINQKQKTSADTCPRDMRIIEKEIKAQKRRQEKLENIILNTLGELEKEKEMLENELSQPDIYSDNEKAREVKKRLDICAAAIEEKTLEWEKLAREI